MACIKGVNRSASVALSPDGPYMAAGTMAGAVDLSFSSSANLEIFKLDFQSDDRELPVVGESPSSERFNRIAWGKNGSGSESFGLGMIAGGLVDGNIDLWNPLSLIGSDASESALVGHLSRHKGPVRGLEFNGITSNLLASGADDGEICIWDLASPAQPSHFPPLKGGGSAAQGEISFVSWNSKVQHILASTSYNGTTVVWDLKKQKPVISFSDSVRRRCSVLQWNPNLATELVVASDEDGSPSLRVWDMRNIMSPVRELVGHTKGVIAMSWCPIDSSYLLTCAKDNRTICWDTITGEIVCELPAGTNWNFDVHWYPKIPGVISASSFDGKIGIYNIEGCSHYVSGENDFGAAHASPLRAPKWYKRPVGASFGFGGKLVSFRSKPISAGASSGSSEVFVHNLVLEDSLVSRSSEFEAAIQNGDRSSLRVLCDRKSQESECEDDQETWGFLKVMFEDDGTARTKLITHLGFSLPTEEKATVEDDLSKEISSIELEDTVADKVGYEGDKEASILATDNGEDFFNNLPSPKADTPLSISGDSFVVGNAVPHAEELQQEPDVLEESADASFDDAVQRALVVGDYKGAVTLCLSANKIADALVIAHVGGPSLWESTRDQYLKMSRIPYLKVVSAMVNNDLMSLVKTRPLKFWKETLALICTFAQGEEWTILCDTLASKLMASGNTLAATLCYMCAGNIDKTVEIWSRSLTVEQERKSYVDLLQDLMEKTIVLALASGQKRFSASLCKLVEKYAEILASQGLLATAMQYLKLLGSDELSPELAILRDCIALSTEPEKEATTMGLENSQLHSGLVYGGDQSKTSMVEASQQYYQETAASQLQQSIPATPYNGNYHQPYVPSYERGYNAPSPYNPAPQPNLFVPPQTPQVPQQNFVAPPASTQPAVRPFVPSTPAALKNAGQYQQPTTLGSQLYPGTINPNYSPVPPGPGSHGHVTSQMASVPGHKMPQVVAPTPTPMGFMPMSNSGAVPRPGMGSMQPPSPTQPSAVQPTLTPVAPPPTVQTVDTSNVPAHQKPVIITLTRLFNETSDALGGSRANPAKKREIEDNSRKIGALFAKLNSGDISKNAADKLVQLCQALDNSDFGTALQIQVLLTTSEWDECNFWLATLKRMIKTRQNVR
ncbi:WD40 domain-containing protein/SRA1 domain-containing protein/Sec16_C domain-containing protein [Cephalotus follicularis]|uniref:WD40 domain-containing protein/SRA1 domain-containing protein/Sec16_C domain-containing protein n=1 Tax=Cephalotus follicularis TaxID=3775 RepID=A0A1Q3DA00_CEPFO|nr:WD40 domain-containing protein/SRA1 domain-containing protein/Sec16_C domain-containing protein [Cephalotus follicularis]